MRVLLSAVIFLTSCMSVQPKKEEMVLKTNAYSEAVKISLGETLQFEDFSLTYVSEVDPEANAEIKSTASVMIRNYNLLTKDSKKQEIKVYYGQLPPRPAEIKLDSGTFVLNSYKSSKEEQLFPEKIEIVKKK